MAAGDWKDMLAAATRGDIELVRYYLREGIDPNYQHPEFLTTPLIEAARVGQAEVCRLLLAHGADPAVVSEFEGIDAREAARQGGFPEVMAMLGGPPPAKNRPWWAWWRR